MTAEAPAAAAATIGAKAALERLLVPVLLEGLGRSGLARPGCRPQDLRTCQQAVPVGASCKKGR